MTELQQTNWMMRSHFDGLPATMKVCKDCGESKPLSEFYKHPQMADGRLSFCKDCKRGYAREHRKENLDRIQAYDRERGKTPKRKALAVALSLRPGYREKKRRYEKKWQSVHPEKRAAHVKVGNAVRDGKLAKQPCEVCGDIEVHARHDDYSKPLDVRWLCKSHHGLIHRRYLDD